MGDEFGQVSEWSEGCSLDWWHTEDPLHDGLRRLVGDLNALYRAQPALWERDEDAAAFRWIDSDDSAHNAISFVRYAKDESPVVVVVNFAGAPHENYRLAFPHAGTWNEVLNTDAETYGGSGVGNLGRVEAVAIPYQGYEASTTVRLPPFGAVFFTPAAE
jgi:1,4-alpha-glucan branching enzyme